MINTTQLVKALINSQHGWAVADQFEDTFEGNNLMDDFERQNINALNYIKYTIEELMEGDVLSDESFDELASYHKVLANYLHGVEGLAF
jgi:hypothetical protein